MIRSRTTTQTAARRKGYIPPRCPRGSTFRRAARSDALQLEHDLPEEEDERARDVEPVREERAVARVRLLLGGHTADGEDHLVRVAGEQVRRGSPRRSTSSPMPVEQRLARSPRSRPGRSRRSPCRSACPPSGTPGCRRSCRAGSRPGWRRSARRDRSPTRAGGACRRPATTPCSARSRRASPAGARGVRDRRSPGRSGRVRRSCLPPPVRLARRRVTRSVYVSSSFVPKTMSRTTPTAEATSAATSAHQKLSTWIALGAIAETALSIAASRSRITPNPASAMNGIRTAATIGGMIAFRTAISECRDGGAAEVAHLDRRHELRGDQQRGRREQPGEQQPTGPEARPGGLPERRILAVRRSRSSESKVEPTTSRIWGTRRPLIEIDGVRAAHRSGLCAGARRTCSGRARRPSPATSMPCSSRTGTTTTSTSRRSSGCRATSPSSFRAGWGGRSRARGFGERGRGRGGRRGPGRRRRRPGDARGARGRAAPGRTALTRSASPCSARAGSSSPATPTSSPRWTGWWTTSTSRCSRSGAGGRRSGPATSTPSGRPRR